MVTSKCVIGFVLLVTAYVAVVRAQCPSGGAASCVNQNSFNQLSQLNPTTYCQTGATLVQQAYACLASCNNAADPTGSLSTFRQKIDQFCAQTASCPNVTGTYITQCACFNQWGGEPALQAVFADFNAGKTVMQNCSYAYWIRSCQQQTDCIYNKNLQLQLLTPDLVLALAVCGSGTTTTLAPYTFVNSQCSSSMDTAIQANCNIASGISQATTQSQICSLFNQQISCFLKYSAGCTDIEQTYMLPRIDTYAIANKYMSCGLMYKNILIQPRPGNPYTFSTAINTCLFQQTVEAAINFETLQPLFNMDVLISGFCPNINNIANSIINCSIAYLALDPPQSKLMPDSNTTNPDASFVPSLGAFPLNKWGMGVIFSYIQANPALCSSTSSKAPWTVPIVPSAADAAAGPAAVATPRAVQNITPAPQPTPSNNHIPGQNNLDPQDLMLQATPASG
jgi:hypothetical protein